MNKIYLPSYTDSYAKIPGQDVAMLICLPDAYNTSQKWPVMIFCHGMGQRGPGTKSALNMVFSGAYQAIPEDWKTAIDKYGIIGVLVNYNEFFQPSSWAFVYNYMKSKFSVVDKWKGDGFSWGGGSLLKEICTPGGPQWACVTPIAPTIEQSSGWDNVAKENIPVCIMVNKGDDNGPTNLSVTQRAVASINAANPPIKATYIAFEQKGHGGTNEALGLVVPGAKENTYEWYKSVLKDGPRQIMLGAATVPVEPIPTTPSVVKAVAMAVLSGDIVNLIGKNSTGWKTGYEGTWIYEAGPSTVTQKDIFPAGSSFIDAKGNVPKDGTYTFRLNLRVGTVSDSATVTVTKGAVVPDPVDPTPIEKKPTGYSFNTGLIQFDDLSFEKAASVTFKTESGKEYTI